MSKAKQILLDLSKELQGQLLSDVFDINGLKYEMKLLTDSENAGVFSLIKTLNTVTFSLTSRLATLSVGIRKIQGFTIAEMFEDDVKEINAKRQKLSDDYAKLKEEELEELNEFLKPFEGFEDEHLERRLLFNWLGDQPSSYIDSLYTKWTELVNRQKELQGSVKKSSQGNSSDSMESSLTENSQAGETSAQDSE